MQSWVWVLNRCQMSTNQQAKSAGGSLTVPFLHCLSQKSLSYTLLLLFSSSSLASFLSPTASGVSLRSRSSAHQLWKSPNHVEFSKNPVCCPLYFCTVNWSIFHSCVCDCMCVRTEERGVEVNLISSISAFETINIFPFCSQQSTAAVGMTSTQHQLHVNPTWGSGNSRLSICHLVHLPLLSTSVKKLYCTLRNVYKWNKKCNFGSMFHNVMPQLSIK